MQELIELGIDTCEATCYWYIKANPITKGWDKPELCVKEPLWPTPPNKVISTFTLQDILEMLPKRIELPTWEVYYLQINPVTWDNKWKVGYPVVHYEEGSLKDAAFNMLKWCKKNNYI